MAFFDTLKQNLMTASQVTMDKAKNTAEILKLKDQIRQDKREIRSATYIQSGRFIGSFTSKTMKRLMRIAFRGLSV